MRVPLFIQSPRKFPLRALAIVVGAGALATAGFAAFSWMPASATRAAASEPIVRPARVMEIAYQQGSQSLVLAGTVVPRKPSPRSIPVAPPGCTTSPPQFKQMWSPGSPSWPLTQRGDRPATECGDWRAGSGGTGRD